MTQPLPPGKLNHLPGWAQAVIRSDQATIARLLSEKRRLRSAVATKVAPTADAPAALPEELYGPWRVESDGAIFNTKNQCVAIATAGLRNAVGAVPGLIAAVRTLLECDFDSPAALAAAHRFALDQLKQAQEPPK